MSNIQMDAIMQVTRSRAEEYLHVARAMILNQFGPATEYQNTEAIVSLAAAMMQYEGSQLMSEALHKAKTD